MEFLTMDEVQEKYNISKATALNWVRLGNLGNFKQGELVISQDDLEKYHMGRLQNRRNKLNREDAFIPQKYVADQRYLKLVSEIIKISGKYKTIKNYKEKILLVIIYKLLLKEGVIHNIEEVIQDVDKLNPVLNNILVEGLGSLVIEPQDYLLLKELLDLEIHEGEGDLLGLLYLSLKGQGHKNKVGSYYTPQSVVKRIIEDLSIDYTSIPRSLDPTCGSGTFLMEQYKKLIEMFGECKKLEIVKSLHGWDTDPIAVALCRINLILLSRTLCVDNIKVNNSLGVKEKGQFDLVIGNPPWGYKFKANEVKELGFSKGSMDSFIMFILKGMDLIKYKGKLCFCLPYSFMNVKSHEHIRRELLKKYKIISITDLGVPFDGVFSGSIILKVSKETHDEYPISLDSLDCFVKVKKTDICSMPLCNFSFVKSNATYDIVKKINGKNVITLKNKATFALGIVTGNNSNYIKNEVFREWEPIIKGTEIYKYGIRHGGNYINFDRNKFQQVAPTEIYRANEKLIYRFINKSLTFAYDCDGLLTLNSANIVIPKIPGLNIKYIMAVLNSRAIQFYYQNIFPSIKVLRHQIESLPIPVIDEWTQNKVISKVDNIINCNDPKLKEIIYGEIDSMVFNIFQLNEKEVKTIVREVEVRNLIK